LIANVHWSKSELNSHQIFSTADFQGQRIHHSFIAPQKN
jgi:hypothetical protein